MTHADAVVLGGGPAGVGAAYRLARRGRRVVVLERGERVGGAAGSFDVGGLRVDHGSHRLHPSISPEVLADLRALLGAELRRRPRHGRIRLVDRWVAFPLRAGDLVRHLPRRFAVRAGRDAALAPLRRPRAETYAEVLRAGLGPAICETFYFPYARKLWGLAPEELSAEQARRRVAARSPLALLRKVVPRRTAADGNGGDGRWFWYPAAGFGAIVERLAEAAVAAGADVRCSSPVTAVRMPSADGADLAVVTADGDEVRAPLALSTVPLTALARLADPPPPAAVQDAADTLRSRAMVLVYLVLDVDRWTAFDAHYLPGPETPVTRVSEPKNYRDSPDDPVGRTVLCAELPCAVGDDLWTGGDEALGALVAEGLGRLGLPPVRPVAVEVRRLPQAYPIYRLGWEESFAVLDGWAAAQRGLVTLGRQGLFAHDNTHHALAMAWAVADAVGDHAGFDEAAWSAARRRFAAHVVED